MLNSAQIIANYILIKNSYNHISHRISNIHLFIDYFFYLQLKISFLFLLLC